MGRFDSGNSPLSITEIRLGFYAKKTTTDGTTVYVAIAAPGSAEASAVWSCYRDITIGGTVKRGWADGNPDFDNVATDLTLLDYEVSSASASPSTSISASPSASASASPSASVSSSAS